MKLPAQVGKYLDWKYSHYVTFFAAGAGLELFMNYFHIGEANIYRSIRKNLSTSRAQDQFEFELDVLKKLELSQDD